MDSSSWKRKRPALKERGSVWPHGRSSGKGRGSRDSGEEGVYGLSKAEADIGPPRLEAHKNALSAHTHIHIGTRTGTHTHRHTQRGTVWSPCVRKGGNARRQNFY